MQFSCDYGTITTLDITIYTTYRSTKLNAVFQRAHKVCIAQFNHMQVVGFFHVLDPLVGLTLGVNHQGPSVTVTVMQNNNNRLQVCCTGVIVYVHLCIVFNIER